MATTFIYVLRDPRNNEVRYLGRTVNPTRRAREHKRRNGSSPRDGAGPRCLWVKELRDAGLSPAMQVVDSCETSARETEAEWIDLLLAHDVRLLNESLEGWGGSPLSVRESFRKKMSAITKGRVWTPESRERNSIANKGKPRNWSPEGEAKVAANRFKAGVNTRDTWTPEQKAKHSAKVQQDSLARWAAMSPEERARMTKERWRVILANRTPEERAAIGAKVRAGQQRDPEAYRRAIREAVARREQRMTEAEKIQRTERIRAARRPVR